MNTDLTARWFDPLFRTEAMSRIFCDRARLQGILDFEAALARAQASAGLVPKAAARAIAGQCRAESFNLAALAAASASSGNSAIPVVGELTRRVSATSKTAAGYVHLGATSQDAMDTGLVLQMRAGLALVEPDARKLCAALAKLAAAHRQTPIAGRTWLQHAAPTTFGLKVAGWLGALTRDLQRLRAARERALVLQFGGATGTLAAFGADAGKITALLAAELKLRQAEMSWHAQRDRPAEVAAALGVLTGSLGKIARDIALMAQTEVAELAEPAEPGRGGSSSMPQKRNPVGCAAVLANAARVPALVAVMLAAMPQEHERGLGGWHAEWETLPEIFLLTHGALAHLRHIIGGLQVDAERMGENLEATRGLIYAESVGTALARAVGKSAAHQLVERACRRAAEERRHLREVVLAEAEITAHLADAEIKSLFTPARHVRAAARLVDRALAAAKTEVAR